MVNTLELYQLADTAAHDIYFYPMLHDKHIGFSIRQDGICSIAIDPFKIYCEADERCVLSHELGHCEMGAFYDERATCDVRQKHENRADKWAIEKMIPEDELFDAVHGGVFELWDLAEYFNVPEVFMKKALCWYVHGNLDVAHYM